MVEGVRLMTAFAYLKSAARPVFNLIFVLAVLALAWSFLLGRADVASFLVRTPKQVFTLLIHNTEINNNDYEKQHVWSILLPPLGLTLRDAGIGFVAGLIAATFVATGTYLSKGFEAATMPTALLVRTVPLVALAPVITLIFGNGFATVAVMSGIVVLFPALINISFGLRSVTAQMKDVITVYGGSEWDVLLRVSYPSALPAIFAAIRISVPGAITGALIAETYTSSNTVGKTANQAIAANNIDLVWSLLVVVTIASILLYVLAQLAERLVLTKFGMDKSLS
jgi:ABC-type nitrate/sulfonate/bicarbonate transport system permease component